MATGIFPFVLSFWIKWYATSLYSDHSYWRYGSFSILMMSSLQILCFLYLFSLINIWKTSAYCFSDSSCNFVSNDMQQAYVLKFSMRDRVLNIYLMTSSPSISYSKKVSRSWDVYLVSNQTLWSLLSIDIEFSRLESIVYGTLSWAPHYMLADWRSKQTNKQHCYSLSLVLAC